MTRSNARRSLAFALAASACLAVAPSPATAQSRPSSVSVTQAGQAECQDLQNRLNTNLRTTVQTAAPRQTTYQYANDVFGIGGALDTVIGGGVLSFDFNTFIQAAIQRMRNSLIARAQNETRNRINQIVQRAGATANIGNLTNAGGAPPIVPPGIFPPGTGPGNYPGGTPPCNPRLERCGPGGLAP